LQNRPNTRRTRRKHSRSRTRRKILVEAVANITIADNQPAATPQKTIIITKETHIEGLGVTDLRRRGSVRDKSLVLKEIYDHPTSEHMKTGVVYILRHRRIKNLFKVGYTKKTAQRRHSDANNCYGTDTDVVYETAGGPFAGSFKAEKIAHCILEEQKLWVKKCEQCDRSHREWFMAEFEVVLQAVQLAEKFLRLPAYDTVDGEIKLSAKAHAMLEPLIFNVDKLEVILASQRTEVQVVEPQKDGSETVTTSIAKEVTITSIEAVAPDDNVPAGYEQGGRKLRSQNLGGRIGNWGNKAKKAVRKFSNPVSRGASPEVEEGGLAQTPASTEELFVKLTWAVMPEEVKASYGGASSGRPRAFSDLKDTVRQYGRDFGEAFNAAMTGKEGKDVPVAKA
jgi:T5orf172 domain-containing protein